LSGNSSGGASGNRPENLYVYGLQGVTSITLSGNSSFVGAIYAPEAVLTLNGGGAANNLIGAAVVNSVTLNGHYDFHYDTYLGGNQNSSYVVASWQEL
jgi:choice-of-anchor A domain-containing protein